MVKTAIDVEKLVRRFVVAAEKRIDVHKVLLTGDYASGTATEDSDIRLLVISPSFIDMEWVERSDLLALVGFKIDSLIQSWGFTPSELDNYGMIPFLTMMINGSREVYSKPAPKNG